MPDWLVKIYLYCLIFVNLFFLALCAVMWLIRRRPIFRAKAIWRDMLFLLSGLISLYIFNLRIWDNWIVWLIASALVIGSVYAVQVIERFRALRGENNRAA